jgi:Abnormal spindle-like microcephaly-assoc'd, ASPM-SPD-2-Hydin
MSPTSTTRSTIRHGRAPLTTICIVLLVVGVLAPPAAAVDTDMAISTTAIDFGTVAVGATAQSSVTLTNTGGDPFGPINIFGGAPPTPEFNASQNCQATTLPAGGSCQVNYSFSPGAPGQYTDVSSFTISETASQSDGEDFSVSLAGQGAGTAITSFTPTKGDPGDPVVITGTGFTGASAVAFNGVAATFTVDSPTQITATVPAGATTGPIAVTVGGSTATSTTSFVVIVRHARTITIELVGDLKARGEVATPDAFGPCESDITVKIQRRRDGVWRTIDTDVTDALGLYRESLPDRPGRYRALIDRLVLNNGAHICHRAHSPGVGNST